MGPDVFRRLVIEHPALYRIAFQRVVPVHQPGPELVAAREAAARRLTAKLARLVGAGLIADDRLPESVIAFEALCEGLANLELRGAVMPWLPAGAEDTAWRAAFGALVQGLAGKA